MMSIRFCMAATALSLSFAAPACAGWWPSQAGAATTAASASTTAAPAPRKAGRTGIAVPEPADFALFAAGVVGLLLGRRGSRSRRD